MGAVLLLTTWCWVTLTFKYPGSSAVPTFLSAIAGNREGQLSHLLQEVRDEGQGGFSPPSTLPHDR